MQNVDHGNLRGWRAGSSLEIATLFRNYICAIEVRSLPISYLRSFRQSEHLHSAEQKSRRTMDKSGNAGCLKFLSVHGNLAYNAKVFS